MAVGVASSMTGVWRAECELVVNESRCAPLMRGTDHTSAEARNATAIYRMDCSVVPAWLARPLST
jgi:hypothetical protein